MRRTLIRQQIRPCKLKHPDIRVAIEAKAGKEKGKASFTVRKVVARKDIPANIILPIQTMIRLKAHKEKLLDLPRTKGRGGNMIRRKFSVMTVKSGPLCK